MQLYGMMNGLEKASATGLDTVARVGQMQVQQQQMKIAQDAAERQRILFEQQQAKEQERDQFNNSYVPLTVFHANIDKQPNRLAHYKESIKAMGGDIKESESGVTLVRPKDIEQYYKMGETKTHLIKQELEMAFKDLDAKNAEITQEISSLMGKDDDKTKARIQKLQTLQLEVQTQMGNTYKATTEYQKQIADAQAKGEQQVAAEKAKQEGKEEGLVVVGHDVLDKKTRKRVYRAPFAPTASSQEPGKLTDIQKKRIDVLSSDIKNIDDQMKNTLAKDKPTLEAKRVKLEKERNDLLGVKTQEQPTFAQKPDASKYKGKIIVDTVTGKKEKSDGKKWVEIK